MTRPSRRGLAALGIVAALSFGAGACGDDEDEPATQAPAGSPVEQGNATDTVTDPGTPEPEPPPEPEEPAPDPDQPTDNSGGVTPEPEPEPEPEPAPDDGGSGGGVSPGSGVDSPENDVPPAPGSPEEQFEAFCDANPDACS